MRKAMVLLAVTGVVLAYSGTAFAAVERTMFRPEPWTSTVQGGIHAKATGSVTVQTIKRGGAQVTVQLQKAAKSYKYVVKSKGKVLGTFTTNAKGTGGLQLFVPDPSSTLGQWINIWQTAGYPDGSYWGSITGDNYEDWYGHVADGTTDQFDGLGLLYGPRW